MKKKRLHQFVKLERGPVNTALMDFLTKEVFQVENEKIEAFEQGRYQDIPEFIADLEQEGMILQLEENEWIPPLTGDDDYKENPAIELEIEEGVDFELIQEIFKGYHVISLIYYGSNKPPVIFPHAQTEVRQKNMESCRTACSMNEGIDEINFETYHFNHTFNSCWGQRVAVTADHFVRPCIYSSLEVGQLGNQDIEQMIEKLKPYWTLTKDNVDTCKICELRYVCFDCREIARLHGNQLFASNPHCKYNPHTGLWEE